MAAPNRTKPIPEVKRTEPRDAPLSAREIQTLLDAVNELVRRENEINAASDQFSR